MSSGCAAAEPATCVACLHSGSTGGRLPRLGSVFCRSARPVAKPPICIGCHALPTDRRLTSQLALVSLLRLGLRPTSDSHRTLILQLGSCPTSGSHRLLLQPWLAPSAAAAFGLRRLPPVCHTGDELPTRIGRSASSFTGFDSLGLRLASLPPAEPLMHPLLQPNLASPAEPSMSIPYPLVRASSGSASFNNFRLASAFALPGATSDPSVAFASGFTLWPDWC